MPNPREAIYDVLQSKQRRREEEERIYGKSKEEAYQEWNEKNQRARSAAALKDSRG
jgi:hypothetical protein